MAKWIVVRNTECEDNSLLPIRADVICVPLNCCILRSSNLQSHCVEHAPWLASACPLLAGFTYKLHENPHLHGICTGLIEFHTQSMKNDGISLPRCICARFLSFRLSSLVLRMMRLLLSNKMNYMIFTCICSVL